MGAETKAERRLTMLNGKRNCRNGGKNGRLGFLVLNQDGERIIGFGVGAGGTGGSEYDLTRGLYFSSSSLH
jgi:hypothetical protein